MGLFCYLRLQIAALIPCDELPGGRLIRSVQGDANLPSRTATAGDTGLRSMLAGDAEKSCNLGFCPAGGIGADRSDFHAPFPLVLLYGQGIDAIVFGMTANEFHKGHLPTEIKGDHQAIVSSCNFEPGALAV